MSNRIPLDGKILGFGPMLPLVAAGIGAWTLPGSWPLIAVQCAVIWGALILAFVAGVRRGYGFGNPAASKRAEIAAAMAYFSIAGLSLIVPRGIQDAAQLQRVSCTTQNDADTVAVAFN